MDSLCLEGMVPVSRGCQIRFASCPWAQQFFWLLDSGFLDCDEVEFQDTKDSLIKKGSLSV